MKRAQRRIITQRFLAYGRGSNLLGVLSLAAAAALLMTVFALHAQMRSVMRQTNLGFDAVLSAGTDQVGAVFQSLFLHPFPAQAASAQLSWHDYQTLKSDARIEEAYPIRLGDNFNGFPLVGCEADLLTAHSFVDSLVDSPVAGQALEIISGGRMFQPQHAEVVLGAYAANELALDVGDTFQPYRGMQFDKTQALGLQLTVVGILAPSHTPLDRGLFAPLAVYGQTHDDVKTSSPAQPALTAVLCTLRGQQSVALASSIANPTAGYSPGVVFAWALPQLVDEVFTAQYWFHGVLTVIAALALACAGLVASCLFYLRVQRQQQQYLLLHAWGLGSADVLRLLLAEAAVLALRSIIWAVVIYMLVLGFAASYVQAALGVHLSLWYWHPVLLIVPFLLAMIYALMAGLSALRLHGLAVGSLSTRTASAAATPTQRGKGD